MSLKHQVATCMLSNILNKEQAVKILDKMPEKIIFVKDNDKELKTRRIINTNLNKSINLLNKLKFPSHNLKIYTYTLPDEYKDFNEYYCATGIDYIDLKDCELRGTENQEKYSLMLDMMNGRR